MLALLCATPLALRYQLAPWAPLWLVVCGGLWGHGPDVHHIAPLYETQLYALHTSPWADLFAFHSTLDRPAVRARYTASVFGSLLCVLAAVSVFTVIVQVHDRTVGAAPTGPRLVALTIALLPTLLLIAATVGALP